MKIGNIFLKKTKPKIENKKLEALVQLEDRLQEHSNDYFIKDEIISLLKVG